MSKRPALAYGLLILLLFLTLTSCQRVDPVVKIGLVAPFEGRHRDVGYDVIYSARLAVREINEAGGIDGTRVALVALDDSGNPEFAGSAARSLVTDPGVVAVVGHWLPQTTAVAEPIYDENDLLFLAGGQEPFAPSPTEEISPAFFDAYTTISPFDETPGENAAPAYAAFSSLWRMLAQVKEDHGAINRQTVQDAMSRRE